MLLMQKEATRTRKERLRKRVLAVRTGLDRGQVEVSGQAILKRVLGLEAYRRAKLVHTYVLQQGKRGGYPHVALHLPSAKQAGGRAGSDAGHEDAGPRADQRPRQLVGGPWGLAQPDPAEAVWLPTEAQIDLVVVPGLAFDRRGQRIGWAAATTTAF